VQLCRQAQALAHQQVTTAGRDDARWQAGHVAMDRRQPGVVECAIAGMPGGGDIHPGVVQRRVTRIVENVAVTLVGQVTPG